MKRREFLQCAALLVTGLNASQVAFSLTREQQRYLATAPNYNLETVDYLSDAQRQIIAAMADIVIPRTDTPGAIDAGVPRFIELMAAQWLNEEERTIFDAGIEDMETRIPAQYGKPFYALDADVQLSIMEDMEKVASDSSWYDFGNLMRDFVSDAPFICQIKELTVYGFFTSEAGARQVLRYDPMPMFFDGDVPLSPDDSTWSTNGVL